MSTTESETSNSHHHHNDLVEDVEEIATGSKPRKEAWMDLVAGTAGGIAQVFSGHPLDTIKVRLQTQPIPKPGESPLYTGLVDCAKKTVRNEGWGGLYKGVTSPLAGVAAQNAILFFAYGAARSYFHENPEDPISLQSALSAGAVAGLAISFAECPVDNFKCKLQIQGQAGVKSSGVKYTGLFDVAKQLSTKYGLQGVYHGFPATLARNLPANVAYFGFYEMTKQEMGGTDNPLAVPVAAAAAGIFYWLACFPFDVIKSTIQTQPANPKDRTIRTMKQAYNSIVSKEGYKGLFKGFAPCMVRSVPANVATFMAYEWTLGLIMGEE